MGWNDHSQTNQSEIHAPQYSELNPFFQDAVLNEFIAFVCAHLKKKKKKKEPTPSLHQERSLSKKSGILSMLWVNKRSKYKPEVKGIVLK